ncbi:MAG TPA: hypothetical protein VF590_12510 [Isosphaeraceae bacterium]
MRVLPVNVVRGLVLLALGVGAGWTSAHAELITIVSDTSTFRQSTTVLTNNSVPWGGAPALPDASTFTIVPTAGALHVDNVPGATNLFSGSGVRFFRSTFTLAPFDAVSLDLRASFDNDLQVFINGQSLALEGSLDASSFAGGVHHRVFVNPEGTLVNGFQGGQMFDRVAPIFPASRFNLGSNELILAVRNLTSNGNMPDSGGFSFQVDFTTFAAVPEPAAAMLLGTGLLCLISYGQRRRSRKATGDPSEAAAGDGPSPR